MGWSMIGGPIISVEASDVFENFYQLISWDGNGYDSAVTIEPTRGYWVLVLEDTYINIGDFS